jgi:hypothetical protein
VAAHGPQKWGEFDYVEHLDRTRAAVWTAGFTDDVTGAAALLHDTPEDTKVAAGWPLVSKLVAAMGDNATATTEAWAWEVSRTVLAVTDKPGLNRKMRKARTLAQIVQFSNDKALAVKLADRLVNRLASPDPRSRYAQMYDREYPTFRGMLWSFGASPRIDSLWALLGQAHPKAVRLHSFEAARASSRHEALAAELKNLSMAMSDGYCAPADQKDVSDRLRAAADLTFALGHLRLR